MQVKVEANTEVLTRAKEKLSSMQIVVAMRMAINEGLTKGRTLVRRGTQETYNIKTSVLNDEKKGIFIKRATKSNLTGYINASHKPLSLKEADPKFQGNTIAQHVTFKNGKARKGKAIKRSVSFVTVEVIKGRRKVLGSAFVPGVVSHGTSGMQFGTTAIFARGKKGKPGFQFAKPRYPIDSLSTVSTGTATTNKRSLDIYNQPVNDYVQQRFVYHIERLIKGVDGME
jgi:hypothetical protein